MTRASRIAASVVVVVAVTATAAIAVAATRPADGQSTPAAASSAPAGGATASARVASATGGARELSTRFLAQWVESGRVIRRDQGGDTVSEGQAYGLLAAVVARDEKSFDAIWTWTRQNLQRPDGLLAWRWQNGKILDQEPATDADLDAARALVLAGTEFSRPDLTAAGTALAGKIADRLTVTTVLGRILVPGLWAARNPAAGNPEGQGQPVAYNPSYASPAAFAVLGKATGDPRWAELQQGSRAVTAQILTATRLPPDWAQVRADGTVDPMPGPAGRGGPVAYGYDAARLALRYGESCSPADRALAARLLPALGRAKAPAAVLDLGGGAMASSSSPVMLASRAAAASAAGDAVLARADLGAATRLADRQPTYYGRAWAMLGNAMIGTTALGGCSGQATP